MCSKQFCIPDTLLGGVINVYSNSVATWRARWNLEPAAAIKCSSVPRSLYKIAKGGAFAFSSRRLVSFIYIWLKTIEIAHPTPVPTPIFYSNPPFWIQTVPTARLLHKI